MEDVLEFWFTESDPSQWFKKDATFDAAIKSRFATATQRALAGELKASSADERLGLILLLDQFPRNLFRGTPRAFTGDTRAVAETRACVAAGDLDADDSPARRQFILMPLMHSESLDVHQEAIPLFAKYTEPMVQDFAKKHRVIIERFGRYPHRNEVLGRESSAEELAFLNEPGSSF